MKHSTTITVRIGESIYAETFDSFDTETIITRLQKIKQDYDREFDASMAIVYQNRPYLQIDIDHDRPTSD